MDPISAEIVEKTWKEMAEMGPDETVGLVDKMVKKQPLIFAYLMASGETNFLNQQEKESLLYMGMAVWRMMSQGNRPLYRITERLLDKIEARNDKMLESLSGESSGDFVAVVQKIFTNYNQVEVLKYVVEGLMEEDGDVEFSDDGKGFLMMCLKNVIDCFDYMPKKKGR
ncbi:MAG: hypothetical protein ACE5I1_08415 [bacterium]